MSDTPKKIFVSHHHSDAPALSQLKDSLAPMGFACFLAHEDIATGEHALEQIKKEIHKCDAFLYISSEKANASHACQQEIGMAIALKKKTVTAATKDHPPKAFISDPQAILYREIDTDFKNKVHGDLQKILFPPLVRKKKWLKSLGYNKFSRIAASNAIYLKDDEWDDFGFQTSFDIMIKNREIGFVKIGYIGQLANKENFYTRNMIPQEFTHLRFPLFSRVIIRPETSEFDDSQIKNLKHLLNDTEYLTPNNQKIVSKESVYSTSLFRYE